LIALAKQGKARILATPKLVVQSGKQADLLVGGELPIAQSTGLSSTVDWKKFGTQLKIAPTVMDEDTVRIALTAIVSEFDYTRTVGDYPTLLSREASTTLQVEDGDTFAIAGLFTNVESRRTRKIPLLGSIPGLGYLFKREERRNKENETIVFFTPRILGQNVLGSAGIPTSLTPSHNMERTKTELEERR
jgi:pilus assembly protein CpaC